MGSGVSALALLDIVLSLGILFSGIVYRLVIISLREKNN
jgi:hypothetical protein